MSLRRNLGLFMIVAVLAAACGAGPEEGGEALSFLLFGGPEEVAAYTALADAFADTPDGFEVALSPMASQGDVMAQLTTSFAGGEPPDVFLVNYLRYGQFAVEDVLAPVQPYLDASEEIAEEEFAPAPLEAFRFDGEALTCLPQNQSRLVVYYNADLFDAAGLDHPAPGWTWDDFLAAAQALTADGVIGAGIEPSLQRLAPFVWSAGGEMVDDPQDPTRLTVAEGPARTGLDFLLDLQLEHGVVPSDVAEQERDSEGRFVAGELGMLFDSRRAVPTLRAGIDGFTWDAAPVPRAPGGEFVTVLHGDGYCLPRAADPDRAWQFVEFANGVEGQEIVAASGRTVPSRLDVASSEVFVASGEPPAASEVFTEDLDAVRPLPSTATWSRMQTSADGILADVFYGRVEREAGITQLVESTAPLLAGGG